MPLQSLRALCKAPGGRGSIWKYLVALLRAASVPGRFVCSFRTELQYANEVATRGDISLGHQFHFTSDASLYPMNPFQSIVTVSHVARQFV